MFIEIYIGSSCKGEIEEVESRSGMRETGIKKRLKEGTQGYLEKTKNNNN